VDLLRDFLADCCLLEPDRWTGSSELRRAYEQWAEQNGDRPIPSRAFAEKLRAKGCVPETRWQGGKNVRGWLGISLGQG
jgi:phage/plasmid-associated DNA primase